MKYEIDRAENGYIVRAIYEPGEYTLDKRVKIEVTVYDKLDDVLRQLIEEYEPGSRHDVSRLYVIRAPGDKNEKFTDEHSKLIWGSDE